MREVGGIGSLCVSRCLVLSWVGVLKADGGRKGSAVSVVDDDAVYVMLLGKEIRAVGGREGEGEAGKWWWWWWVWRRGFGERGGLWCRRSLGGWAMELGFFVW